MKKYEALYILDTQGKEEGLKEIIDQLEAEIKAHGGKMTGTRKMDRRRFENIAGKLDSGYYLGIDFQMNPEKLIALQQKLKLNSLIYRQFYLCAEEKARQAVAA